jgi:hypothetical protein
LTAYVSGGSEMQDLSAKFERLFGEAEECELIGRLATDLGKRELFTRLATDLRGMTRDIQAMIAEHRSRSRFPSGITHAASLTFAVAPLAQIRSARRLGTGREGGRVIHARTSESPEGASRRKRPGSFNSRTGAYLHSICGKRLRAIAQKRIPT